ncbi:hypothetical protein L226DRAFT_296722 [Lentinus tigrinus ALCF2SS1-7]|uniref:uncharacterized protein n=1 Tax=Lentinus tigrinus ALCF2SS1-7 TaxID=1328758 RepID=UPI0011662224|nr:hypothetical protein L226DRAFT_296722 [Lentinus tigrinus ALCF2SS1-7]
MGDADWDPSMKTHAELVPFVTEWPCGEMGQIDVVSNPTPCPSPLQPLTLLNSENWSPTVSCALGCHSVVSHSGNSPGTTLASVSTAFNLNSRLLPIPPDIVLVTLDGVLFYVHTKKLLRSSSNRFNGLLSPKREAPLHPEALLSVDEHSSVMNIVLHSVYNLSCAHYNHSLETLCAAVDAMSKFGISPQEHVVPTKPLFALILNQAPLQPILAYSTAASHDIAELAVAVSSHTLSIDLQTITYEIAAKMGPVYLRRLFFLHLGRLEALKTLLISPPPLHPCTSTCDFGDQKRLTRAWTLASAHLAWEARPGTWSAPPQSVPDRPLSLSRADLSVSAIETVLCPLADHLPCEMCKENLAERIKQLVVQWSMVKVRLVARVASL